VWRNAPGSWLLGLSIASKSSDDSSLMDSSGEGVTGDIGCLGARTKSAGSGRGGSDILHK
jgi:hypothetical protein